jgi:hypothetical protein
MRQEIKNLPERIDNNLVLLGNRFLMDESIIKKLIESQEDFPIILFGSDNIIGDNSIPVEQQHDFFSTSASLSGEPTEGIKETKEDGAPARATILAIRRARYFDETKPVSIAIVEQSTEKGLRKAWYCLPEQYIFKQGDFVLVTPITEYYYGGGERETYRLTPAGGDLSSNASTIK